MILITVVVVAVVDDDDDVVNDDDDDDDDEGQVALGWELVDGPALLKAGAERKAKRRYEKKKE